MRYVLNPFNKVYEISSIQVTSIEYGSFDLLRVSNDCPESGWPTAENYLEKERPLVKLEFSV